jgi:hypothetical protein
MLGVRSCNHTFHSGLGGFGVIHKKVDPAQGIFLSLCKIWGMNKLKRMIEGPAELTKVS